MKPLGRLAPRVRSETPWGTAQHVEPIATGIYRVSTPGHGGFFCDDERDAVVRILFPDFQPYAGCPGWYEEDCDWAVVALAHYRSFSPGQLRGAVRTVECLLRGNDPRFIDERFRPVLAWLNESADGRQIRALVAEFTESIADKWEVD